MNILCTCVMFKLSLTFCRPELNLSGFQRERLSSAASETSQCRWLLGARWETVSGVKLSNSWRCSSRGQYLKEPLVFEVVEHEKLNKVSFFLLVFARLLLRWMFHHPPAPRQITVISEPGVHAWYFGLHLILSLKYLSKSWKSRLELELNSTWIKTQTKIWKWRIFFSPKPKKDHKSNQYLCYSYSLTISWHQSSSTKPEIIWNCIIPYIFIFFSDRNLTSYSPSMGVM